MLKLKFFVVALRNEDGLGKNVENPVRHVSLWGGREERGETGYLFERTRRCKIKKMNEIKCTRRIKL